MARHELNIQQPALQRMLQECGVAPSLFSELTAQMDLAASASFVVFDMGDFAHRSLCTLLSSRLLHLPHRQLPRRHAAHAGQARVRLAHHPPQALQEAPRLREVHHA